MDTYSICRQEIERFLRACYRISCAPHTSDHYFVSFATYRWSRVNNAPEIISHASSSYGGAHG